MAPCWERLALGEPGNTVIIDEIRSLMTRCGDRLLSHDPLWLTIGGADNAEMYGLRRNGRLIGYAPFVRGFRTLRFGIGELTLYGYRTQALTLPHDITLATTSEDDRAELISSLLQLLAAQVPPRPAIFVEGVPTESALFAVLTKLGAGSGWIIAPVGEQYEHQFADLPPSFEQYESQLGSRSRQSLRYSRRKLFEHLGGRAEVRRFSNKDDIPKFVSDAQEISQKTFQWRLLNLGLRNATSLTKRLNFAADRRWMHSYILYCRDNPVAFMLGYLYLGIFHYIDIGYDPAWSKWSVGSILHMEVMKELLSGSERPDRFDFSTGFGIHKARFGNTSRREANLIMLPHGIYNRVLIGSYILTSLVEKMATSVVNTLGIKPQIKKWLRRVS